MHSKPFKNIWWKCSCKKIRKKSPSGTILPHCMYFWPAQRGQFGSVLFSLSVYWPHLAINKKENKLPWIILVKCLQYYSCHFMFRQYFVKNYPDEKKSQVSIPFVGTGYFQWDQYLTTDCHLIYLHIFYIKF